MTQDFSLPFPGLQVAHLAAFLFFPVDTTVLVTWASRMLTVKRNAGLSDGQRGPVLMNLTADVLVGAHQ